jgi:hypothetical protein
MKRKLFKKWYLMLSFLLSLYLVAVTIIGFTTVSPDVKEPLEKAAHVILWFFVAELVVLFVLTKDFRKFWKEQWISILAVGTSISVTQLLHSIAGIGSLTGLQALKGLKSIKGIKGLKLFKATKGVKVAKSYKIGKKAKKAAEEVEELKKKERPPED